MNPPLRILHVDHTATVSGAEYSLLELARQLHARHELLLACPAGDLERRAAALGVPVVRIPGMSGSWRSGPARAAVAITAMLRSAIVLRRAARRHRSDVVHANSVRAGLIAVCARALGGPPVVVHVRDRTGAGLRPALIRLLLRRGATRLIAVSELVAADWRAGGDEPVVIANPIDCERFAPDAADRARWRAQQAIGADQLVVLVLGQLTEWKRQDLAIEAFACLLGEGCEATLLIAGEVKFAGRDIALDNRAFERALRARCAAPDVAGRVRLLGERGDVPSLLRASDLLLAPAAGEPFGRAVAEALACGTPVVAGADGGPAEFVRDGRDGLLVAHDAPAAIWARACRRVLELDDAEHRADRRAHACERLSSTRHAALVETQLAAATRRGAR